MLRRWWNYIKTWFGMKSKEVMDPKVEIEAAINEARKNDQNLRNEAAKVVAHRTKVANGVEDAAADVAESKELAKQALLKADAAATAGNAADSEKWNQAAASIATKVQSSQSRLDSLQAQLTTADQQAEQAKSAVHDNAVRLDQIATQRMELMGQLEQAKMQESVNKAMESIDATVGGDSPSLKEIENKIQDRMAEASAKTELKEATPEGIMAELERDADLAGATAALDDLRSELGLGPPPAIGAGPESPAIESSGTESAAPESAAPESAAPESAAPESAAPESAAPESAAPESPATESPGPQSPGTETPGAQMPGTQNPPPAGGSPT